MILRKVIHVKWSFKQFSSGILPYRYGNTIPKEARGTEPPDIYSEGSKFLPIHLLAYPPSYLFTYLSTNFLNLPICLQVPTDVPKYNGFQLSVEKTIHCNHNGQSEERFTPSLANGKSEKLKSGKLVEVQETRLFR